MAFLGGLFGGVAPFPQTYQTPQNIKDFMQPIPVSEMQAASIAQNLLGAKQGYDTAQKSMDLIQNALQTPDVGEDMRNKWQRKLNEYKQARDAAAQTANSLRNTAATLGIDVSDYGNDKTLQESNQAFQNHKQMAFKNFLNLPTQKELEDDLYAKMRLRGASPRTAEAIVSEERGAIKQQLARRLNDFMGTYGKNPDGSIDQDVGIAAIGSVLQDPQQVAQLFVSGFAMPQKVYDANQQRNTQLDVASLNNAAALERVMANIDANWRNAEAQRETQKTLLDWSLDSREKEAQLDREHAERLAAVKLASGLGNGGNGQSQYMKDINDLVNVLEASGLSKEEATSRAIDVATKKHFKDFYNEKVEDIRKNIEAGVALGLTGNDLEDYVKTKAGWKPKEGSKAQGIFNQFDVMFDNVIQGNIDEAGKMFQALDENAEINQDEFFKQFDKDELPKYKALSDAYKKYFDVGRNAETADEKTLADAKDNLIASVRAVKRGTTASDELAAMKNARATVRRTHGEEKPADNSMARANQNARALLGDKNTNNGTAQPPQWDAYGTYNQGRGTRQYNGWDAYGTQTR